MMAIPIPAGRSESRGILSSAAASAGAASWVISAAMVGGTVVAVVLGVEVMGMVVTTGTVVGVSVVSADVTVI